MCDGFVVFSPLVVPAITQSPQSVSIGVGASFTLSCSASGNPTPSFTWSKDGNTLANDGSHIVINGGTVTVSNVVQSEHMCEHEKFYNDVGQLEEKKRQSH